jgi:predicted amino acid-binding ACT domain protein
MCSVLTILYQKEQAIITAFDELAVIHATGKPTIPILQGVLTPLRNYPVNELSLSQTIIADKVISMAIEVLERSIKERKAQNAIYHVGQLLGIALEYTQSAISQQFLKH